MEMLNEAGVREANIAIEEFKKSLNNAAADVIGDLYTNLSCYIDTDAFQNYRSGIVNQFAGWSEDMYASEKRDIANGLLKNHREEVSNQIIENLGLEIEDLRKQLFESEERYRDQIRSNY